MDDSRAEVCKPMTSLQMLPEITTSAHHLLQLGFQCLYVAELPTSLSAFPSYFAGFDRTLPSVGFMRCLRAALWRRMVSGQEA